MSQLIQLRTRIKAIETIKKITHAMRLISMSSHTRMRSKEEQFKEYLDTLQAVTALVKEACPEWQHPIFNPDPSKANLNLIILVGSQRGLCGNFNTLLIHFFESLPKSQQLLIIPVGKKAVNYIATHKQYNIAMSFPDLSLQTMGGIAYSIVRYILTSPGHFAHVQVISNKLRTFFLQRPQLSDLIPYTAEPAQMANATQESLADYIWEQNPSDLLDHLMIQKIQAHIHYLLYQSLLAEQAARFISMDNATRNAQNILDTTKLTYNKLRQAKITKELTELTGTL